MADFSAFGILAEGHGTRSSPAHLRSESDLARAEGVAGDASALQQEANNGKAGHIRFRGLPITVQVPRGGTRRGVTSDGKEWQSPNIKAAYGHVRGTQSADGSPVDVIVGPAASSEHAYLIDQIDPKTGAYDETKAIIGVPSMGDAIQAYASMFSDGRWAHRIGAIRKIHINHFRKWAKSAQASLPFDHSLRLGSGAHRAQTPGAKTHEIAKARRVWETARKAQESGGE